MKNLQRNDSWLIGYDIDEFNQLTEYYNQQLSQFKTPPTIFLAEENPFRFLAAFVAAISSNTFLFLCNPFWKQQEWEQVFHLVTPDIVWGNVPNIKRNSAIATSQLPLENAIMIPTGGSSGKIRFAIHTWQTLTASVNGFCSYFGNSPVNSFCILPLYHVSGLMQFLRSLLTQGRILILSHKDFKSQSKSLFLDQSFTDFFISLVPTQLQFILEENPTWLSQFKTVLLGGAPPWKALLESARNYNIRLAPTYGMTETASQVVTLKPNDFLSGNNSNGQLLPHANIKICNNRNESLFVNETGILKVSTKSLCLGYYPDLFTNSSYFQTDDLGFFDQNGYLHIVGRNSRKIITGGENVHPNEVESVILATGLIQDVCVIGLPDTTWGEVITAVYVPHSDMISISEIKASLENQLSRYKQPKYWIKIESLPRNLQGKVCYNEVEKMAIDSFRKI
ncbi:MAG: 2-succinylbenzoate--CoA ligase [Chroococcales cyanobacterium]